MDFNSDIYKTFILLVDIISSLLYISLQAAVSNEVLAIVSLAVFVTFGIGSLVAMFVIAFIILVGKNDDNAWSFFTADCSIIVGAFFYFIGDNLPPILATFSEQLSCNQQCIEQAQTAGRCLLFITLIFFRVVPLLLRKWLAVSNYVQKEVTDKNLLAASFLIHMLALMVEYDAIYSVVWGNDSIAIDGVCSASDLSGSWACWTFSFVIWTAFVVVYFLLANKGLNGDVLKDITAFILMMIALVLLCGTLGIYLLGDNDEPIGCVCSGGFNSTSVSSAGCSDITGKRIRSGLMGGTLSGVIGTVVIIVLFLVRGS